MADGGFGYGSREDSKMYKRSSIFEKATLGQIKSHKQNPAIFRENLKFINNTVKL